MGSYVDVIENAILDHIFGKTTYTAPATLYLALSTTTITDAGGSLTEPSGGNYSRVAITNNTTNFPNASGGSKSNGVAITTPTASAGWGTILDFALMDAATAGSMVCYGTLTASKAILTGDKLIIEIGGLVITQG